MKYRTFVLCTMGEEGGDLQIAIKANSNGKVGESTLAFRTKASKQGDKKREIRAKDKCWVYSHIPSSIWWFSEIHHDWNDGGRVYFLTHAEHRIKTKEERKWVS